MSALPVYRWRLAPEGLATFRQLRALGLRPGGAPVVAQLERPRRRRGPLVAYLYRVDTAKPVRPMTPRQAGGPGQGERGPAGLPAVRAGRRIPHPADARHVRPVCCLTGG